MFKCQICKKAFSDDSEDWGNLCMRCSSIYQDAMMEQAERRQEQENE